MRKQLVVAGLLLLIGITAQGYTTLNPTLDTRWASGNVLWHINLGAYDSQANAALADWSQYTGATHLLGIDAASGGSWMDGRNEIRWALPSENMPSNVLAWTLPNYNWQTGLFIETDIEFNPRFLWGSFDSYGIGYDVNRVLLHEIGHGIGLGHTSGLNIMNSYYQYDVWTLSSDDIAGARHLYGRNSVPESGGSLGLMALALAGVVCMRRYA